MRSLHSRPCRDRPAPSRIVSVPLPSVSWEASEVLCAFSACIYQYVPLVLTTTQGLWKEGNPLFSNGMQIGMSAIGNHGAWFNSSSIAIVELILDTLPKDGTPAQVLFTYLQASFTSNPKDIKHLRCTFNLHRKDLIPKHRRKVGTIVKTLNR